MRGFLYCEEVFAQKSENKKVSQFLKLNQKEHTGFTRNQQVLAVAIVRQGVYTRWSYSRYFFAGLFLFGFFLPDFGSHRLEWFGSRSFEDRP